MNKINTIDMRGIFHIVHVNKDGKVLNDFVCKNKISDLGKLDTLDTMLGMAGFGTAAWYCGLVDDNFTSFTNGGAAASPQSDEFTDYDEATRIQIDTLMGAAASGGGYASIENVVATSPATFTISTGVSGQALNGIFITDTSAKSAAETNLFWCTAAFGNNDSSPAPITVNAGDTVKVGYKCQIAL